MNSYSHIYYDTDKDIDTDSHCDCDYNYHKPFYKYEVRCWRILCCHWYTAFLACSLFSCPASDILEDYRERISDVASRCINSNCTQFDSHLLWCYILKIANLKEIRANADTEHKTWETFGNRSNFYVFNHRGRVIFQT
ncbi:hypothetical protein EB796_023195 [Bugula neritina]|uniref:Uncharacterized protein n=1 Tax=Bugula neritina TaxID=10212 RepID=A0A7J7IXC9_BUGNE|nr:hypothetical protein EB796_023195 [Bugula neritina]